VLGYEDIEPDLPVHRAMGDQAEHIGDSLTLVPRGFFKSTIITIAGTMQFGLRHPNRCVLITSWTLANARGFLREILELLAICEKFRTLFPEAVPHDWKEEGTQITYDWPMRTKARKEGSIDVSGVDQTVTSRHYDRVVVDDAVVKENVPPWATIETLMKVIEWFNSLNAILKITDPFSHKTVVGTRWHDFDLYGYIQDAERSELFRYYKIYKVTPYSDADQQVSVWPSKFPLDRLAKLRADMKEYMWACLMMQNPLPPDSAVRFDHSWFHEFEGESPPGRLAITVDPAFSEKSAHADRSAIACTSIGQDNALWIDRLAAGRWSPSTLLDRIVAMWEQSGAEWVGIEVDGGGRMVYDRLRDRNRERGISMRLVKLKTKGKRKPARIAGLQEYVQTYGCYYRRPMLPLIEEVLRYPVAGHDDIPDALAHRILKLDRLPPPREEVKEDGPPQGVLYMRGQDIIDRFTKKKTPLLWIG
jgi:hypothetical protein